MQPFLHLDKKVLLKNMQTANRKPLVPLSRPPRQLSPNSLPTEISDGPMDLRTKNTEDQTKTPDLPTSSQPGEQVAEPRVAHTVPHTFQWTTTGKTPITITCNTHGGVEDSLKRSHQFKDMAKKNKNKNKELVIIRKGSAISSDFPCCLIQPGECLTVKYIKAADKPVKRSGGRRRASRKELPDELVTFCIETRGGPSVRNVLRNNALRNKIQEITVFGFKGEKIKHVLKKDVRIKPIIFTKNFILVDRNTQEKTEMLNLVDDLEGKSFTITKLKGSPPPDSQSSLDDFYVTAGEGIEDPASVTDKSVKKEKPAPPDTPEGIWEIPNSKLMQGQLSSQFNELLKVMKAQKQPKSSNVQNLFREEFGKNDQSCRQVQTLKKLMERSNSVCLVRINGLPKGSGFLLVKGFVLTNFHVMKGAFDPQGGQVHEMVTVHFSFESQDAGTEIGAKVVEVVAFEYEKNGPGPELDWALLRLGADQPVCDGLLSCFGVLPPSGGICIIGHPGGGVKQVDTCYVIPPESRCWAVEQYSEKYKEEVRIQLITPTFFKNVAENVKLQQVLTYDTCFNYGSSGSPVFDEYCNVVAMHSAGYTHHTTNKTTKSVIEYAYPLSHMMERILIQVVNRGRFDVLKAFRSCKNPQYLRVMEKVKEQVQSRTFTAPNEANWNATVEEMSLLYEHSSQSSAMEID